jgi:hypothetical protein
VDAIGPAAAGRVRDHNARWMAERDVHEVEVVALYALAARSA